MTNKERESINNMTRCKKFESCSIPKCPLDLLRAKRTRLADEPVCKTPYLKKEDV